MDKNVVLVTLDALRKDRIGIYNPEKELTPYIDRLAEKSVIFENCFTVSNTSAPSHTSILSGCYPMSHGLRRNGWKVNESTVFLSEVLKKQGLRTVGAVSQEMLTSTYNFNKGFDVFFDNSKMDKVMKKLSKIGTRKVNMRKIVQFFFVDTHSRAGKNTIAEVVNWVESNYKERFFLFMHLFDVHRDTFAEENRGIELDEVKRYDENVSIVDKLFGRLLNSLEKLELMKNTMIIVMADHGECLGEFRKKSHGYTLLDVEFKVPLIIYHPSLKPQRVRKMCRTIDVFPTTLELAGIKEKRNIDGISLLSMIRGEEDVTEVFMEGGLNYLDIRGIRTKEWKYIIKNGKEEFLYDMNCDPDEKANVKDKEKDVTIKLREKVKKHFECNENREQETDEHTKKMLKKLGYLE